MKLFSLPSLKSGGEGKERGWDKAITSSLAERDFLVFWAFGMNYTYTLGNVLCPVTSYFSPSLRLLDTSNSV